MLLTSCYCCMLVAEAVRWLLKLQIATEVVACNVCFGEWLLRLFSVLFIYVLR